MENKTNEMEEQANFTATVANNKSLAEKKQAKIDKGIYLVGVLLTLGMVVTYFILKQLKLADRFMDEGPGFINYVATAAFIVILTIKSIIQRGFKFWKINPKLRSVSIAMLCISAYTINLSFPVFNKFATWVEVSLFLVLLPLLTVGLYQKMNPLLRFVYNLLSGLGIILAFYFTIYLIPMIPIGVIGTLFLGLGIHVFAPILFLITLILNYLRENHSNTQRIALFSGILVPLFIVLIYVGKWSGVRNELHKAHASIITNENNELPNWVLLSQNVNDDYFTNTLIKGDIYYAIPDKGRWDWFDMPRRSGSIVAVHDPLVFLAFAIFGDLPISREDRLKIIESQYAARHHTEEKLWRGDDLRTVEVLNNIKIYPDYRFAYTEKNISIQNTRTSSWTSSEEALYSFHVPEGSVVSSLSLWVDGEERKSRLTTKKRATAAYTKIVGVERRDPALAHWQEGNRITVRVFPCTQHENRMFKIGITTPLKLVGDELFYENFYFEGPALKNTMETTLVRIESAETVNPTFNSDFNLTKPNTYQYTGSYNPELKISLKKSKVSSSPFCFNGNCYQMKEQDKSAEKMDLKNVYIDINNTMTMDELNQIMSVFKAQSKYVFLDGFVVLTEGNKEMIFDQLSDKQFTLFPIHQIVTKRNLIITKNSNLGPNLSDLIKSDFKVNLSNYLQQQNDPLKVISLNHLSDYWSSLNQLQVIDVHHANSDELQEILTNGFPVKSNSDEVVYIDNANVHITKIENVENSTAPDHLLRLFAFNQLMKKIGYRFYNREQFEDELFVIANEAFILSPISSMVVLETDQDYETHGIKKNEKSLNNATISSSGAVPEPHEWALIIVAVLSLFALYYKKINTSKVA